MENTSRGDMETLTLEHAQEKLTILIENAVTDHSKYLITSGHGDAVLLSREAYDNLMLTLEMFCTPILLENMHEMH